MDFENELNEFKEKTRAMCDAMGCLELLDDYLVEIEVSRPTYYHFYEAGQQSKQAEIDDLKNKIQTALNKACMLQNSSGERIYTELKEILK